MAATTIITRHANYGLELVDALSGGPLVGASSVALVGSDVDPFLVNQSRWVFEDIPPGAATFDVTAEGYLSRTLSTGTPDLPNVPASSSPGFLASVSLTPRVGYPFAANLTRVLGQVRLAAGVDPTMPLVDDADVSITGVHGVVDGAILTTRTTDGGQYTGWFVPDPTKTPPLADHCKVTATKIVGGFPRTGSLPSTPIDANTLTELPTIFLS